MADELDLGKLNELFNKAESCDKDNFAEYKNNVLLVAGKHWHNARKRLYNRIRDTEIDQNTKVRLTKNHIGVVERAWTNQILSQAPWVKPFPHTESEPQDSKAAEIAEAVWNDAKHRYNLLAKRDIWVKNFFTISECHTKIFWDPNKGKCVGYEQAQDEDGNLLYHDQAGQPTINPHPTDEFGNPHLDQTGQPIQHEPMKSDKAVMSGDFVFETILGFNLLRDPACETLEESPYLIVRKMMDIDDAKKLAGNDEEKLKSLSSSKETTFKVFDGSKLDYVDSKNQVLIKEIYFRPCQKYPEGQFCIYTSECILVEPQPLPHGIFPIVSECFANVVTTPRGVSLIRDLRPLQANLNQLASQKMQHELTVGDDKLVLSGGSKVEKGSDFPGIRTIKVTGAPPTIIEGRSGDQFIQSIQAVTDEIYKVAGVDYLFEDVPAQMDPNAMLFRSLRQKKIFSQPAERFERFLINVCKTFLQLHRCYCPDDMFIRAVGKNEAVNIKEWKNTEDIDYMIKLEPVGEDIETAMGRALRIQTILQYAGDKIPAESIPQIVSAMPDLNAHEMFGDLLQDETDAKNVILALDRGEMPTPRKYDNHKYMIKKLNSRMRERSFDLLDPKIQQNYESYLAMQEEFENEELMQIKMLEQQVIPTTGPLVTIQLYESVPNSTGGMKAQYMKLPTDTILWVKKALQTQGTFTEEFQDLPQSAQAQIAQHNGQNPNPGGQNQNLQGQKPQGDVNGNGQQPDSGEFA